MTDDTINPQPPEQPPTTLSASPVPVAPAAAPWPRVPAPEVEVRLSYPRSGSEADLIGRQMIADALERRGEAKFRVDIRVRQPDGQYNRVLPGTSALVTARSERAVGWWLTEMFRWLELMDGAVLDDQGQKEEER